MVVIMVAEPRYELLVGAGSWEVADFEEKRELGVGEP